MNISELNDSRHKILEQLNDELNENSVAAVLRKEEGEPEMVSALLDELGDGDRGIIGDFYFKPLTSEEDPAQIFMSVFTISDSIPAERLPALYEAISYVNFNLPAGCFSIDKDHRFLCYVLSTILPLELSEEEAYVQTDMSVSNALFFADGYIGILCDVLDGKVEPDGVIEFLGGPDEDTDSEE